MTSDPMTPCSYLFVPADRPDRFGKALQSGAGAVIIDLEDAVADARKVDARHALATWLDRPDAETVLVRTNAPGSVWFDDDLRLCAHRRVGGVVIPKAESVDELAAADPHVAGTPLLPLIETAAGFDAVRRLAARIGVARLLFGAIDFQLDLGIEGDDDALLFFRSQLVLASRRAGLPAPVDGVTVALDDDELLLRETSRARRLGFGGKLCIHPRQVHGVNVSFNPSAPELSWARRVLAAVRDSGGAAVAVDGKMVDTPVVLRAQRLLERSTAMA
jgi:citrate lyase subunit beta / citryl-CoA lyase